MQATLTKSELRSLAPAALATEPANSVSKTYKFYPTSAIIDALASENWAVIEARTANSRTPTTMPATYRKHEIVFADRDILKKKHTVHEIPRIMLTNAHDANAACRMYAGLYRFICSNGMVISDGVVQSVRITHTHRTIEEVVATAQAFRANTQLIGEHVDAFKRKLLTQAEINHFARQAIVLRQPKNPESIITPNDILAVKRSEDVGDDLWHVFNRAQEWLLHGGFPIYRHDATKGWTMKDARPIKGIDQTTQLNADLWALAEQYSLN
jgi:hypothetical protein